MILREYQETALTSLIDYFNHNTGNPLVVMPTGTGKSVVIAAFIQYALLTYRGTRIIQVTHVKELIEQNFEKLLAVWPIAPAGICAAGLDRREFNCPITFCGIATVYQKAQQFGHIDLIIVDEAHLLSPNETSMYQLFIGQLLLINPRLKVIGFTATDFRVGQGLLTEGENALFTANAIDMSTLEWFNWFIAQGYLSRLIPRKVDFEYDLTGVGEQRGDWNNTQLQAAIDREHLTKKIVTQMIDYGQGRNHWLIFAAGIKHAEHVTEVLQEYGVSAEAVHSKDTKNRSKKVAAFKAGEFTALVNNGVLTTGFDFPGIDLLGILRPTKSPGLWGQILGRGTRPCYAPGYDLSTREGRLRAIASGEKPDCLVLDFTPNTRTLGPINALKKPKSGARKKSEGGAAVTPVVKLCPICPTTNAAAARFCINCGHEFPVNIRLEESASVLPLIAESKPEIIEWVTVDKVAYLRHQKKGKPPCLRVCYYCGLHVINEFIHLEGRGMMTMTAFNWWRTRALTTVPLTADEALPLCNGLRVPKKLKVDFTFAHPEVIDYEW